MCSQLSLHYFDTEENVTNVIILRQVLECLEFRFMDMISLERVSHTKCKNVCNIFSCSDLTAL